MGIRYLNSFLRANCSNAIKCIQMSDLSGKKIAIDISIFMYKFETEGSLIENMYLMLSIFKHYNIIPIFIFDGHPPTEKKELLMKRREDKVKAEQEYKILKNMLSAASSAVMDDTEKQELISSMDVLKKKFVYIKREHIAKVKTLIRAFGATYYDAPGEADELCAMLVMKEKVWACLSEDMDMFVYGCSRVLRYFSLMNHTAVLYNLDEMLVDLGITLKEFKEICVLSGTDYNQDLSKDLPKDQSRLVITLKLFKKYHKSNNPNSLEFYSWLLKHQANYITNYDELRNTYLMFELSERSDNLKVFENISIMNGPVVKEMMRSILEEDGFIFPI
uniref:XPG N-terminal domain-containing protein n=1 Tax=viral metagenome TaxID=1070528 RepID=A0A6C0HVU0_9ZZZZ